MVASELSVIVGSLSTLNAAVKVYLGELAAKKSVVGCGCLRGRISAKLIFSICHYFCGAPSYNINGLGHLWSITNQFGNLRHLGAIVTWNIKETCMSSSL